MEEFDTLKLENQLCFPLYAASKEVIRRYKPLLEELDLTYTEYIAIMVLWSEKEMNIKSLGEKLYLDTGTLTPLLKKLESKGYVTRIRNKNDERNVIISITEKGTALKSQAKNIPDKICKCVNLSDQEMIMLHELLFKILGK